MNLYQFAANNSINSVDPFGLWPCWLQNLWNLIFAPGTGTGYDPFEAPNYLSEDPYNQPDNPFYIPNEPVNPLYMPYFQFDANGNLVDPGASNFELAVDATAEAVDQINQAIADNPILIMAQPELGVEASVSGAIAGDAALATWEGEGGSLGAADEPDLDQLLQARNTAGTALSVAQQSAEDADAAFTQLDQELSNAARNADSPDEISEDLSFATQDAKTQLEQANTVLQAAQKNFDAAQDAVLNFGQ